MASKEDPAVQFWEFVQENLLQFHCENVSWEQASDKIPIKVVVELLGDLITHVNTCLLLRSNRLLFTLNWETIENGQAVWEHLHSSHLNQKRRLETPQYQCDYMLTSVSSYTDLVDTYCYVFDKQPHPSFMREDIFEPGQLPVSESIEVWYLPPQFGSTPKKAIPQLIPTVRQPKSIQDMGHDECIELVQKLLKEKEESSKPQTHLHPNPSPPLDFTEAGNIPNPGMNQESFLQCSQVMLQGLADKGFIHAKSPKFDLFFGMKDKNKIEFDMWERQVLAAATDHSDTAIRQAMLQSLKGQALMVTTILPPNTHWKELLQALRIKYQSKAPYDVLMSQFYSTKMDTSEDYASFGIRLVQKLNQVTLQYPDKISTESYWNHVKDRFFHGLSPIMKANLRTEFQSGSDYYQLLDIARKIEAENMPADSTTETNKPANSKGKPKVGAITVDSTTAQQLSQLQGAVKGLTNLVKGVQLNTNTTQSSQNPNPGTGQPTPQNQNSTPSSKGRGGRNGRGSGRGRGGFRPRSGKILCYWCQDFVSEEEASHKIANCPYQSTARSDWWKTQMDKKSTHSTDPEGNC